VLQQALLWGELPQHNLASMVSIVVASRFSPLAYSQDNVLLELVQLGGMTVDVSFDPFQVILL
jgi:hypothetical protein